MDIFIKNASVVATMDDDNNEYRNYDILLNGSMIKAIGQNLNPPNDARIIDGRGKLVLPGFVNTHHHMFQIFTRDLRRHLAATDLFDWLNKMYRTWHEVNAEMVYTSALVELGMLAKTGCTLVSDNHYLFPDTTDKKLIDAQIQAAKEIGVRFHPTRGAVSPSNLKVPLAPRNVTQTDDEILQDYERVVSAYHDPSEFSMVRIGLGPTNPVTTTETVMRETIRFARKHGLRCHTHLSEDPEEEVWSLSTKGKRLFDYVEDLGWVGPDVWYAHCLFINDDEIRRMGQYHCGIATNPVCNARSQGKIARVFDMLDAGIKVGIGVDGSGSYSDMVAEIQAGALLHTYIGEQTKNNPRENRPDIAMEMLKIATRGGASVLGWDKVGSIVPGNAADLSLFNIESLEYAGILTDPVTSLVLYGSNHNTDTTIVNGEIIVENGKLKNVDENSLVQRVNSIAREFLHRIPDLSA
jgi:8-oxoguanine deaminase